MIEAFISASWVSRYVIKRALLHFSDHLLTFATLLIGHLCVPQSMTPFDRLVVHFILYEQIEISCIQFARWITLNKTVNVVTISYIKFTTLKSILFKLIFLLFYICYILYYTISLNLLISNEDINVVFPLENTFLFVRHYINDTPLRECSSVELDAW